MKDRRGSSGILAISPFHEPGDLEELWDLDEILEPLVPLRREILEGDLRPLYLAQLAVSCDGEHDPDETVEAPVPAGLNQLTDPQRALAALYGLSDALITAAAKASPPPPSVGDAAAQCAPWIGRQPEAAKNNWLAQLMHGTDQSVRAEILAQFTKDRPQPAWPTIEGGRTITQLQTAAEEIQAAINRQAADKAARQRAARLTEMAADPSPFLRETEQLAGQRSTDSYRKAAELLADLRDALLGSAQADLAEQQARKLKEYHPTLNHLTAALRKQGFIPR